MKNNYLSIVIPTNGKNLISVKRLLDSIDRFININKEIILVCNPANLNFENEVLAFSAAEVKVLQCASRGVNYARSLGLKAASSDYVLFLDDDVFFESEFDIQSWISQIMNENLFAIGGEYTFFSLRPNLFQKTYFHQQINWLKGGLVNPALFYQAYLLGGFFLLNKPIASSFGIEFDVSMIFGSTEKDFFLAAFHQGLSLKYSKAQIGHEYAGGLFGYLVKIFKQGRGQRHIDLKSRPVFVPLYVVDNGQQNIAVELIYNLAYWWGYYSYDQSYFAFVKSLFRSSRLGFVKINEYRIRILNSLKKDL